MSRPKGGTGDPTGAMSVAVLNAGLPLAVETDSRLKSLLIGLEEALS